MQFTRHDLSAHFDIRLRTASDAHPTAGVRLLCHRYQHLDAYLPILPSPTEASAVGSASASDGPAPNALSTSVAGPGRTESGRTDGSRVNAVGLPAASRRQEAVSRYRAEMPDPWRQLPDIDFTGREERRGGTKGNGRGIKRQQASNPGATSLADRSVTGAGAGGDDGGSFNGDNGDGSGGSNDRGRGNSQVSGDGNVVSVDVGDDFLALSAGSAVPSAGRKFVVQDVRPNDDLSCTEIVRRAYWAGLLRSFRA